MLQLTGDPVPVKDKWFGKRMEKYTGFSDTYYVHAYACYVNKMIEGALISGVFIKRETIGLILSTYKVL